MESWQKLLIAAGGAAGVAALFCYLLQDEESEAEASAVAASKSSKSMSKEELLEFLKQMADSNALAQANVAAVAKKMGEQEELGEAADFDAAYKSVEIPADPMDAKGLTPDDFELLLQRHQSDPEVMKAFVAAVHSGRELGPPSGMDSERIQAITVAKLVEVMEYQSEVLENFLKDYAGRENKKDYDIKKVMQVLHATLTFKVQQKFQLEIDKEIEAAIMARQAELANNKEFAEAYMKIRTVMDNLPERLKA